MRDPFLSINGASVHGGISKYMTLLHLQEFNATCTEVQNKRTDDTLGSMEHGALWL